MYDFSDRHTRSLGQQASTSANTEVGSAHLCQMRARSVVQVLTSQQSQTVQMDRVKRSQSSMMMPQQALKHLTSLTRNHGPLAGLAVTSQRALTCRCERSHSGKLEFLLLIGRLAAAEHCTSYEASHDTRWSSQCAIVHLRSTVPSWSPAAGRSRFCKCDAQAHMRILL